MLNNGLKKEAIAEFERSVELHNQEIEKTIGLSEELLDERHHLRNQLKKTWGFLNRIRNKPAMMEFEVEEIKIEFDKFDDFIFDVKQEIEKNFKSTVGGAGAGVVAGAGVATFGPTAAMAIATTFGTASTGAAISGLSGAAATNAALAWLGGGAVAAGGGGMAAGNAFLALAGPIGWAIGGGALVTAGLFQRGKNKKIAEEALKKSAEVSASTKLVKGTNQEIVETKRLTVLHQRELFETTVEMNSLLQTYDYNFERFQHDDNLVQRLGALVNNSSSAGELLNRAIGAESK